ncbi:amylo-alpha-1,6-glucosidase [Microcoleus sp. FACHB-68]|uniref:amylo-alpha-1,6-glucosidase n=1 Tax=Microcoleus sp. FACHB-68 TaxID=2692826 RepID=UPI0016862F86|nr:amylo-alpha-1,6-glucosidase [Microcoleus sp. FACHB-68]MBD1939867.1 glycogen debranching enzyme family protein [Microcoleus sp. FACHB-68]
MDELDTREWLLTNGLGSFAGGTVCDAHTRTYHGWLIAALEPPSRRTLLLSHLEATLDVAGQIFGLGTNFWGGGAVFPLGFNLLRSFEIEPVPTWIWGQDNWQLTRQLVMPYGRREEEQRERGGKGEQELRNSLSSAQFPNLQPELCHRLLIQYHYTGSQVATLRLRPLIADRDFHHQQSADPGLQFWQEAGSRQVRLQAIRNGEPGTPWQLRWSAGDYQPQGLWYWNYQYLEETRRGLGDREDLYSTGELSVSLQPGDAVVLEARVGWPEAPLSDLSSVDFEAAVEAEQQRLDRLFGRLSPPDAGEPVWRQMLKASDQFIVYRSSIDGPTVIAGYPWFNDWGRDTLIALPGLALATGRFDIARGLLETFARYCQQGLIPNAFPDAGGEPFYNSLDATLWWVETLGLYLEASQDWDFLNFAYPVVRQIYKAFTAGTRYNIQVDASDGLVTWDAAGVALTWMDAVIDGLPVTPRRGKPVEINALWYSALCWASQWAERLARDAGERSGNYQNQVRNYSQKAAIVKASLSKFWNSQQGYLYDTLEPDGRADPRIRPNAVLALSLHHCAFSEGQGRRVLQVARDRLLTPYGLRSLDPGDPGYIGGYAGDRWHRDRAYHQGTVWSWLIGPYIRAWQRFYPNEPVAFDWMPVLEHFQHQACFGSISEIFDGDAPHAPQGAIAQAWSVAEILRHFADSQTYNNSGG